MVRLVLPDAAARRDAVAFLLGRYSFQCRGGDLFAGDRAAEALRRAGVPVSDGGPADDLGFHLPDANGPMAMRRFDIHLPLPATADRAIADALLALEPGVANIAFTSAADHVWPPRFDRERDTAVVLHVYAVDTEASAAAIRECCERLKEVLRRDRLWVASVAFELTW